MFLKRVTGSLITAGLLLASACSAQNGTLPASGAVSAPAPGAVALVRPAQPEDSTSILKKLTKTVEIGSTVDPKNGDEGPHSLAMSTDAYGEIKNHDFVVCDFDNSAGTPGDGESVELLSSTPGSKPVTFVQSSTLKGCDGAAIMPGNGVFVTGLTSKELCYFNEDGKAGKCKTNPPTDPLTNAYGAVPDTTSGFYSPYFDFVGDVGAGAVDIYSLGGYGTKTIYPGVSGLPVSKVNGWQTLGPSGLAYNNDNGTLYVVDGVCNAVMAIDHVPNVLIPNEIVVGKGCKTFKCKDAKATCGKLVKAGSPLNGPEAETLLPNHNLIVANTKTNELVEMTPTGTVLDTKVVDTGTSAAVLGLWATGTNDNNTVLYYTDANSNTVEELEQ